MATVQPAEAPLYISDLDGTLLHGRLIDPRGIELLNSALRRGVLLTYATARSWTSAESLLAGIDLQLPLVLHNGAVTFDPLARRPIVVRFVCRRAVRVVVDMAVGAGLCPIVHTLGEEERTVWCSESEDRYVRAFWAGRGQDPRRAPVLALDALPLDNVIGIALLGEQPRLRQLQKDLGEQLREGIATGLREPSSPEEGWWLEVAAAGVSKGPAARDLADRLGIRRLISFGDDYNDLSLFGMSDESYAVATAPSEVQQAATGRLEGGPLSVAAWIAEHGIAAGV